ncbi:MAG: sulfatase [Candidatus Eisenbacteria bacterium]
MPRANGSPDGPAGQRGRATHRRLRAPDVLVSALLCGWLGALAGVVEGPFRAFGHGHYFNTILSYATFLLIPAVSYAAFAVPLGVLLAFGASFVARRRRVVPTAASLAAALLVVLYWGSVFREPLFSTPGNIVGHAGMVLTAVAVFALLRRLLEAVAGAPRPRRRALVLLALSACVALAFSGLAGRRLLSGGERDGAGPAETSAADPGARDAGSAGAGGASALRNVLLVTIDTTRADHLGCYGRAPGTTPRSDGLGTSPAVDALAAAGVRFENAVVPEIATDPSHASIMTALHPLEHGVLRNGQQLAPRFATVAEAFRAAGFGTGAAVSVEHLDGYMSGLSRGFADYYDRGPHDRFRYHLGWRSMPDSWREAAFAHTSTADETCRRARGWLRGNASGPFFMWVHLFEPHMPYVSHEEPGVVFGREDANAVPGPRSAAALRGADIYDSEIRYADDAVGGLLAVLDELGVRDRTVVVVTSDHGEHMSEERLERERWFGHSEVYEEACRVPLVVYVPGMHVAGTQAEGTRAVVRRPPGDEAGRAVSELVTTMDLAPTLLDLAGIDGASAAFAGRSMLPLLEGGEWAERPVVVLGNPHTQTESVALRGGRWKLVARGGEPLELYDLAQDPGERMNVAHSHPSLADSMSAVLAGFVDAWGPAAVRTDVDPEVQEMLRALGYLQ